jgi:metal-dependent amidase/aminoacylase/carboxypeptidase family protein
VNALDAVLQTFAAVNALRQHVRPDVRIHGIITDGGRATNIVPDFARCEISVRSVDPGYLSALVEKVLNCARAAALASGARLEASQAEAYAPIRENRVLDGLVLEVMEDLGCPCEDLRGACFPASTDFGNVSQVVPATVVMFKVAPPGVVLHHPDFAAASVSPEADEVVLTAARVLAVAAARLVTDPARLEEVRAAGR